MVERLCYDISIDILADGFPLMGMCENISWFSWAGGYPCFKRGSVEFLVKILLYIYLYTFFIKWVVNSFPNGLGYHIPCGSLDGA